MPGKIQPELRAESERQIAALLVDQLTQAAEPGVLNLSTSDMARISGSSRGTAWSLAKRLQERGILERLSHKKYRFKRLPKDLRRRDLSGINLRGMDLSHVDLSRTNLAGADLEGANLQGAMLYRANFKEANLKEADLFEAEAFGVNWQGADLTNVRAMGAIFPRCDFRGATLDNFQYGTPLQHQDMMDHCTMDDQGVYKIRGVPNVHFIIGKLVYLTLLEEFGPVSSAFVGGLIESEQYDCWQEAIARFAGLFPEHFIFYAQKWRTDPRIDPLAAFWLELELGIMAHRLEGKPVIEFWEGLIPHAPNKTWTLFCRWQKNLDQGLHAVASREEINQLGGCRPDCYQGEDHSALRPNGPPTILNKKEMKNLYSCIEQLGVQSYEGLGKKMEVFGDIKRLPKK